MEIKKYMGALQINLQQHCFLSKGLMGYVVVLRAIQSILATSTTIVKG